MTTNVHLTPELERFARQCVKSGRFNNVSEVVRSAMRMMQESENQRRRFMSMLDAARAEADRDGVHEVADIAADLDKIVAAGKRAKR